MGNGNHAIRLTGIRKTYGDKTAVEDLDFSVPAGTICGLLGPNGAGKTTTIRIILDIIGADAGRVEVLGSPLTPGIRDRIGYLPEERGLYSKMRVHELLVFLGQLKGVERPAASERAGRWLERLELGDWSERKVDELSKGMQQKVQFIGTVLHEPDLLILDEPFAGLDPLNIDLVRDLVIEQKDSGRTVLLSTHNMDQAERLCERVIMIRDARKVLDGRLSEIKEAAWRAGQRRVILDARGDLGFLEDGGLVRGVVDQGTHQLVSLQEDVEPDRLLQVAVTAGAEIRRFEVTEPSLHEIFVTRARE